MALTVGIDATKFVTVSTAERDRVINLFKEGVHFYWSHPITVDGASWALDVQVVDDLTGIEIPEATGDRVSFESGHILSPAIAIHDGSRTRPFVIRHLCRVTVFPCDGCRGRFRHHRGRAEFAVLVSGCAARSALASRAR